MLPSPASSVPPAPTYDIDVRPLTRPKRPSGGESGRVTIREGAGFRGGRSRPPAPRWPLQGFWAWAVAPLFTGSIRLSSPFRLPYATAVHHPRTNLSYSPSSRDRPWQTTQSASIYYRGGPLRPLVSCALWPRAAWGVPEVVYFHPQPALSSGRPHVGPIHGRVIGRSGLGDAAVKYRQAWRHKPGAQQRPYQRRDGTTAAGGAAPQQSSVGGRPASRAVPRSLAGNGGGILGIARKVSCAVVHQQVRFLYHMGGSKAVYAGGSPHRGGSCDCAASGLAVHAGRQRARKAPAHAPMKCAPCPMDGWIRERWPHHPSTSSPVSCACL